MELSVCTDCEMPLDVCTPAQPRPLGKVADVLHSHPTACTVHWDLPSTSSALPAQSAIPRFPGQLLRPMESRRDTSTATTTAALCVHPAG
jgi:hypothetical protein